MNDVRAGGRSIPRSMAVAALAVALGAGCAWSTPTADAAPSSHADVAARPTGTVLRLTFDDRSPLTAGAKVDNAAGRGHGTVLLSRGHFKKVKGKPGRAARYPTAHGYGLIELPDRKVWDPARREFTFGATVKIPVAQGAHNMNIIQKGYYAQPGGQWKLQLDRGLPSCVVRGSTGRLLARAETSVADGRWHRLVCTRTRAGVALRVDGTVAASAAGPTGRVANSSAVRIGAKKLGPGRVDQFHGRLDVPFLKVR